MCKIVHVAVEIVNTCIDKNISIDYFKVQKLAYLCQCRHLCKNYFIMHLSVLRTHLLFFEKETVNEVLSQYGEKDFTSLTHLTKTDPVFSEIPIGNEVPINKITKYFTEITENTIG